MQRAWNPSSGEKIYLPSYDHISVRSMQLQSTHFPSNISICYKIIVRSMQSVHFVFEAYCSLGQDADGPLLTSPLVAKVLFCNLLELHLLKCFKDNSLVATLPGCFWYHFNNQDDIAGCTEVREDPCPSVAQVKPFLPSYISLNPISKTET